jgi:glycosyltransferase involved in cell wall biosynthesis
VSRRRILFIHNWLSSFVRYDLEILRQTYDVTEVSLVARRPQRWLMVPWLVQKHDLVFGWFASRHTLWPMLWARFFGRPSLLVIGGYDLANLPAIGYGHQRGGLDKRVSCLTMRMARQLMTNSHYSRSEAQENASIPKEQVEVIYHGVPDPFGALPQDPKEHMVLTVGVVKRRNLHRKGHEAFVRTARLMPNCEFVLIGDWEDDAIEVLRPLAPHNVTFTGWVERPTLLEYYRRAALYVQASRHEGFGLSVAEAMLAGCIPVVTRAGALPEVVGDTGVYTTSASPEAIASGVQAALAMDDGHRRRARERVLREFPMEQRRRRLLALIESCWQARDDDDV